MSVPVCGGDLCVLWVAGGIISGIFEVAPKYLEDLSLSILAQSPHKELCLREPSKPDEGSRE